MRKILYGLLIFSIFTTFSFAQSRSSGGFRSSGSSSSFRSFSSRPSSSYSPPKPSMPSPSRSSGGFKSTPSVKTPSIAPSSKPSSSKSSGSTRESGGFKSSGTPSSATSHTPKTEIDKALFNKTKQAGITTQPRQQQIEEFKANNASKYTSKYKTEPTSRPSHIPNTYSSGGNTYNVIYNPAYGGYGYWHSGSFILYDAMRDMAMLSVLMNHNNSTHVINTTDGTATVVTSNNGWIIFPFVILFVALLFVILYSVYRE